MKNIMLIIVLGTAGIFLTFFSYQDNKMTSKKLVAKCADALGGYDIINNVKSLSIKAVYPDHGNHPMELIIKRPNQSFNPKANIVFDGKRICFLKGRDGNSAPELVDEEEWKDGEVEIGYHFPAFFDYPSDFRGIENVDGRQFYNLKVDLPLGAKMTYFIDVETFLTSKVMFEFSINGKEFKDWRDFKDYKEVDGFKYPHSFTYNSRTGRQNGWIHSLEINAPVSADIFKIPEVINK